jgi:hypothetical protein
MLFGQKMRGPKERHTKNPFRERQKLWQNEFLPLKKNLKISELVFRVKSIWC